LRFKRRDGVEVIEIKNKSGDVLKTVEAESLSYSNLRYSNLSYSNLSYSNLRGSNLSYSDLSYSDLRYNNLSYSNLSYSNLRGSNLSYSDLRYSNLSGSDLSYSNLSGSNLRGSNLSGSNLRYSNLREIRSDLFVVLDATKNEVTGLRLALIEGRVNGAVYEGECCCLVGTIANLRHQNYKTMCDLIPQSSRPAERWFLGIATGDKVETNQIVAITVDWIDEWLAKEGTVLK
jgi:uncharacterized protein YjbI with pentapeptide repeats